ncbi:MAG: MlaD family protein [Desulfotignum sp.]
MRHIRHASFLLSAPVYSILTVLLCALLFAGCTGHRFNISFDQIDGLKQKDPVIFEKKTVGQVKKITYTQDAKFQVSVEIAEAFSDHATEDSRFFIGNVPGDSATKAVIIEQSRAGGKKIPNDAVVDGSTKSPVDTAAESIEEMWQVMGKKMADLMAQLETLPETEEYQAMKDAMAELEQKLKSSGQKMEDTLKNDILPLLEEKIKALSDSLRQQGKENQAEELEKDFGRLQDI